MMTLTFAWSLGRSALFSAGDALGFAPSTHLASDGRGGDRGRTLTPTPQQVRLLSQLFGETPEI